MTRNQKYAKYTDAEIIKGCEYLETKVEENKKAMDTFLRSGDIEFLQAATEQYLDNAKRLIAVYNEAGARGI